MIQGVLRVQDAGPEDAGGVGEQILEDEFRLVPEIAGKAFAVGMPAKNTFAPRCHPDISAVVFREGIHHGTGAAFQAVEVGAVVTVHSIVGAYPERPGRIFQQAGYIGAGGRVQRVPEENGTVKTVHVPIQRSPALS